MVKVTQKDVATVHDFPNANTFLPGAGGFVVIGKGSRLASGETQFDDIQAIFAGDRVLKVETDDGVMTTAKAETSGGLPA